MAHLSLVIVPAKVLTSGKHKVRIAVSHNSETRYIATDVTVDNTRQFRNGQVYGRPDANILNAKLRKTIGKYQARLDDMEYIEALKCAELVYALKDSTGDKNMSIKEAYEQMKKYSSTKASTQETMDTAYHSLTRYIREDTPVRKITRLTVLGYDKYLKGKKLSPGTINNYMNLLFMLISFARKCGIVDTNFNPGEGYRRAPMPVRDSWLSCSDIRKIRDFQCKTKERRIVRDFFMLSYYLGGINMVDLKEIDFNVCTKEMRYKRSKVRDRCGTEVRYIMPQEARDIIKRIKNKDGRLSVPFKHFDSFITRQMRFLRKEIGIPNLVFYSARKSFSQHAFELGISTQVIDYILGHSPRAHGIIYHYVSVKPEMATEAIRKVIDNLNKEEGA